MRFEGSRTPKTADPVSKMTVKGWRGVPTPTSMKYCVPFLLKMGIWSTCVPFEGLQGYLDSENSPPHRNTIGP